jgi:putative oxidoreductase
MGRVDGQRRADRAVTLMRKISPVYFKIAEWGLRLGIGGAFIYAGWLKAQDPVSFADSVNSFAILPSRLISTFALALPMFEIVAGVLLVINWPKRIGALALMSLTAVFCVALVLAIARGLDVNCGCFGPSASTTNPWVDLTRDLLIVSGCVCLYRSDWLYNRVTARREILTAT